MESINSQSNFDIQDQNFFGTKKFRYSPPSGSMTSADDDFQVDTEAVKIRCRALKWLYADDNSTKFAEEIGVEYKAWNAALNSGNLSKNVAFRIITKYPGISLYWLWFGDTDTQAPAITRQLEAAVEQSSVKPSKKRVS